MSRIRLVLATGAIAFLGACASTGSGPQSEAEYDKSMAAAQQTLEQGGSDKAIAQFEEIAARNPAKGEPWSYIAKVRFDEQKYGQAIVAAEEALSRDSQDFVAKSVRAVGGLRVAMQALSDVRSDALLAGNTRADALALAAAMRETLGQDVLFPDGRKPRGAANGRAPARAPAATSAPARSETPAAAPANAPAASPAVPRPPAGATPNPFGDLLGR